MHQVDLIRRYTLRKVNELRIFISMLPVREEEALQRLSGPDRVKNTARIVDLILQELGHPPPTIDASGHSPTIRAARQVVGKRV